MGKLDKFTLRDIAEIMAEAEEMGVAINIQIVPFMTHEKVDNSSDEEGAVND